MLRPDYLDKIPSAMVELYGQAEADILADMARRISAYDYYIPAAQHQHRKLQEMGMCHDQILRALSGLTGRTSKELESLIAEAGAEALRADDAVYRQASLIPNPLSASPGIQEVLRAGLRNTQGLFTNLARTTANTAAGQFERALDRAYMQIATGAFDASAAIRMAVKDLARQGVESVKYPSGRVDTIETAVRRAVVTGVNQAALKAQDARAKEIGCDLVEATAHAGARPSHALWQGGVYSRSGRDGRYPGLAEATGYGTGEGLGGWNCRHSMMPYFEGMPRAYTPEMLEGYDAKAVPYNGQMLTEYEASQRQRYIERQQRRWKREYKAMEAAGQDTGEAAAKLKQWRDAERDFLRQTGFKRQGDRSQVAGFGRSEAAKITALNQRTSRLAQARQTAYNYKIEEIRALIRSEDTPKELNTGNQSKHIPGSRGYMAGRSYIYGGLEEAQALVGRYSGTGEPKLNSKQEWTHKEFIVADKPIGVYISQNAGEEAETRRFAIHYGKKGTHIVPAKELE